jgi:hypothetical protein
MRSVDVIGTCVGFRPGTDLAARRRKPELELLESDGQRPRVAVVFVGGRRMAVGQSGQSGSEIRE